MVINKSDSEALPSCRSPESPGLQSPDPPCRHTDTPPHCEAPHCRGAPSPPTTGRGNHPHTSLKTGDSPVWTHIKTTYLYCNMHINNTHSTSMRTVHPHADNSVKTVRSPESLPSGMVLFSISFCFSSGSAGKTSEGQTGAEKDRTIRHTEKDTQMY